MESEPLGACFGQPYMDKAALSFGRTSTGIVWYFEGIFGTIETTATATTMEYLIAALVLNCTNILTQYLSEELKQ